MNFQFKTKHITETVSEGKHFFPFSPPLPFFVNNNRVFFFVYQGVSNLSFSKCIPSFTWTNEKPLHLKKLITRAKNDATYSIFSHVPILPETEQ